MLAAILFFSLFSLGPSRASAQNNSDQLVEIFLGEGPKVNMNLSPSLMSLSVPFYVKEEYCSQAICTGELDDANVGLYYLLRDSEVAPYKEKIQVFNKSHLTLAVSSYLSSTFLNAQLKTDTNALGMAPLDCLKLAIILTKNFQDTTEKKHLTRLSDCTEVNEFLVNETSTVYSMKAIEVFKNVICKRP